jgi:hypothetical protein
MHFARVAFAAAGYYLVEFRRNEVIGNLPGLVPMPGANYRKSVLVGSAKM